MEADQAMLRPGSHLEEQPGHDDTLGLELRRLRQTRGLSQRKLAGLLGFTAHSAISDYESGKRLPPNDVLLAYERLFHLSPGRLQEQRVRHLAQRAESQYQQSLRPHPDSDQQPNDPQTAEEQPEATPAGPRPVSRMTFLTRPSRRPLLITAVAAAALTAAALAAIAFVLPDGSRAPGLLWASGARTQHVSDKSLRNTPEPMDGDDPRARGCDADASVRQSVPLLLPDRTAFGRLRLRHSDQCGTNWGSALYSNPHMYTVFIQVTRPADHAEVRSQWSNNTPPGSYGDMLSTGTGCVTVEAWVRTPQGSGPHARTSCMR